VTTWLFEEPELELMVFPPHEMVPIIAVTTAEAATTRRMRPPSILQAKTIPNRPKPSSQVAKKRPCPLRRFMAELPDVAVTVRMELAVPAPGVTDPGANEHFKLLGSPEHVSSIALLKEPDCGATLTVSVPDAPEAMVIAEGVASRVNPEPPPWVPLHVSAALTAGEIWFVMLAFPKA